MQPRVERTEVNTALLQWPVEAANVQRPIGLPSTSQTYKVLPPKQNAFPMAWYEAQHSGLLKEYYSTAITKYLFNHSFLYVPDVLGKKKKTTVPQILPHHFLSFNIIF